MKQLRIIALLLWVFVYPGVLAGKKTVKQDFDNRLKDTTMPVVIMSDKNTKVVMINPETGAPVTNVTVIARDANEILGRSHVDKYGVATIDKTTRLSYMYFSLMKNRKVYPMGECYTYNNIRRDSVEENISRKVQILTDKAVYCPGEKVRAVVMAYKSIKEFIETTQIATLDGVEVTVKLLDANDKKVNEISGKTDEYGRLGCEFDLPADGTNGEFKIFACLNDEKESATSDFLVLGYEKPDLEIIDSEVTMDLPAKGDVTLSGVVRTKSGGPVTDAKVDVRIAETSHIYWFFNPERLVYKTTLTADTEGRYMVVVPGGVLVGYDKCFETRITATAPDGSTASANASFCTKRPYYTYVYNNVQYVINGQEPYRPDVRVYAPGNVLTQIPLVWRLDKEYEQPVASGDYNGELDFSDITPGNYVFVIWPADPDNGYGNFCGVQIYNTATDIIPKDVLWVDSRSGSRETRQHSHIKGEPVKILYGTAEDNTIVYYSVAWNDEIQYVKNLKCDKGYHTLEINLPDDIEDASVVLFTAHNFEFEYDVVQIDPKDTNLKIECESLIEKLEPETEKTFRFRVLEADGTPCEAAVVLDMYNTVLDGLYKQPYKFKFDRWFKRCWQGVETPTIYPDDGLSGDTACSIPATKNKPDYNTFEYPDGDATVAAWAPMLTTDKDGYITYTFTVPDADTGWQLHVVAWTKDGCLGTLEHDFEASR